MTPQQTTTAQPAKAGRVLLRFDHPDPPRQSQAARHSVLPVFLPFAGCPQRCIFCDQTAQTGQAPEPLDGIFDRLHTQLAKTADAAPQELAFYGGTFTALPAPWPQRFLSLAGRFLASGRLCRVRCSTRPDAVDVAQLAELKALGLSLVELGVQSFDDAALAASRRGYDGQTARQACAVVREAGLGLGIQLMPGLPGHSLQAFQADIVQAAAFAPELTRLYPCLVLAGTPLAELWRAGAYAPWTLDATVDALALALLTLWAAGAPAARIGLAEQEGLDVLAGPRHPALGQMARSRALLLHVRQRLDELPETERPLARLLKLPRRLQGEALGQRNALAQEYAALGLSVRFWEQAGLALCAAE
jgi:histone acetyltransferase (RNA polymerase elongator complex component)